MQCRRARVRGDSTAPTPECTKCADWDPSRIPYTQIDVCGNPEVAHPRRLSTTDVNEAILVVHAAAKHDKDVGGGTGFTKATALLYLQQRGLSTAARVEAVQRALANDPPRLHPLLAIIGRSMLMSLSHELFLGLLKSFVHDVEVALKRQSLGAPHLLALQDLLGKAPGGVSWFQASAVGGCRSFVGTQLAAVLRCLPWLLGQVAERDSRLALQTVNAAILEMGSALWHLGAVLHCRKVTPGVAVAADEAARHTLDCVCRFQIKLLPPDDGRVSSTLWGARTNLASLLVVGPQLLEFGSNLNDECSDFGYETCQKWIKPHFQGGGRSHVGNLGRYRFALDEISAQVVSEAYLPPLRGHNAQAASHCQCSRADLASKLGAGDWIISVTRPPGTAHKDWFVVIRPSASASPGRFGLRARPCLGGSVTLVGLDYLVWDLNPDGPLVDLAAEARIGSKPCFSRSFGTPPQELKLGTHW